MKNFFISTMMLLASFVYGQDVVVQTLTFDSTKRAYTFKFPDKSETYRKIVMRYGMRCKNAQISDSNDRNKGCGEWDYSCNTYITIPDKKDSVKATHPNYVISGFDGDKFDYTTIPTYSYFSYKQKKQNNITIKSEKKSVFGTKKSINKLSLSSQLHSGKKQYLYTAKELKASGMTPNKAITGLILDIASLGDEINYLRIKIKHTAISALTNGHDAELDGFKEVYFLNTKFSANGLQQLDFYQDFVWDGTNGILLELSFTNKKGGKSSTLHSTTTPQNTSLETNTKDKYLVIADGHNYGELSKPIDLGIKSYTIELWVKPPSSRSDPSIVSDKNWASGANKGFIIFQSNSKWKVNLGDGTNRVDVFGGDFVTDGKWHHIAVVIDRKKQEIITYHDGEKANSLDISKIQNSSNGGTIKIAQDGTGVYAKKWPGMIDDLRIWKTVRSQEDIKKWMRKNIKPTDPEHKKLWTLHTFNNIINATSTDASANQNDIKLKNVIRQRLYRGVEVFKGFSLSSLRPNTTFVQGEYSKRSAKDITVLDSLGNLPNTVRKYRIENNDLKLTSTKRYYQAGDMPVYKGNTNVKVGAKKVIKENTLTIKTLNYFKKFPSKIEIMSFVTPYGLGLDLGVKGKFWEFDMTDYSTILRGEKLMSVELDGAFQEELNIQFLYYKGTPPRNVISLSNIWRPRVRRSYEDLSADKYYEPREIILPKNSKMHKIRTSITGHLRKGEFMPRTHYLNFNNGAKKLEWRVWKECADNPIYPQGGTWIFDRAGWCPGAPTDTKEYEVPSSLIKNNKITVDYGVKDGADQTEYYISSQLVSYGTPNFTNDASIIDVMNPSKKVEYSRFNPSCMNPRIIIQNTGSQVLKSVTIAYNVSGGKAQKFTWKGSLKFLETEQVQLPIPSDEFWEGDKKNIFIAKIVKTNNQTDDYPANNIISSKFDPVDSYKEEFTIDLMTNLRASENNYSITNNEGKKLYEFGLFGNSQQYKQTPKLSRGCYTLKLEDSGHDGLYFWFFRDRGSGHFKLFKKNKQELIKEFNPDFGSFVQYNFFIDKKRITNIEKPNLEKGFSIYPNPTLGNITLSIAAMQGSHSTIRITNLLGHIYLQKNIENQRSNSEASFDISNLPSGIYLVELISENEHIVKKIVKN